MCSRFTKDTIQQIIHTEGMLYSSGYANTLRTYIEKQIQIQKKQHIQVDQ